MRLLRRPLIVWSVALLVAAGCAPKQALLAPDELSRPQRVLLVTIDRAPARVSSWRPGLSLGIGLGSFGSSVSGGVDMTHERGGAERIRAFLDEWNFRPELQRLLLARTPPPGAWRWVDGDATPAAVLAEIDKVYLDRKTPAPLLAAHAAANNIDKVFVVDPVPWGITREGLAVTLKGSLFEPTAEVSRVWTGEGRPQRARRPFFEAGLESERDRESVRQVILESAAESAEALMRELEASAPAAK